MESINYDYLLFEKTIVKSRKKMMVFHIMNYCIDIFATQKRSEILIHKNKRKNGYTSR